MTQFKKGELAIVKEAIGSAREFYKEGDMVVITVGNSVESSAVEVRPVGKGKEPARGWFSNIFWVSQLERIPNKVGVDGRIGQHGLLRGIHCWKNEDTVLFENTPLLTNGDLYLNRDANINGEIKDIVGFRNTIGLPEYSNQIVWDGEKIDLAQYNLGDKVKGLMARFGTPDREDDLVEGVITQIDEPMDDNTIEIKVTTGKLEGETIWLDNTQGIEVIKKAEPTTEKLSFDELTEKFAELERAKDEYARANRQFERHASYLEEYQEATEEAFAEWKALEDELSEYLNM